MGANRLREGIERIMEKTVKVRTTFRPDQEVEMTATEAEDLRRQGLLAKDTEKETPAQGRVRKGEQA